MFGAESSYQVSPAAVILRINHGLFRRAIENRFLTAFYGVLRDDGAFTFTNAGHNAPVLVSASGVRRLETGGMVLGLFEHATFDEETVILQPGDFIIAFSDGVTEALNEAGEEYMDDRLLASIDRHRGLAPEALVASLLADVHSFAGAATPNDDLTLVMVRYDRPRT
jgi:sigma-B regulation protein RsbU (phosphoserine phosphatase)